MRFFRRNPTISSSGRYRLMRTINAHRGGISCVAISRDGSLVASGANDGTKIWQVTNGQALDGPPRRASAVSAIMWITRTDTDTTNIPELLCFGTGRGELAIWQRISDGGFDEILHKTIGNAHEVTALACNERGDGDVRIAVGTIDNNIYAFTFDGSELHQIFSRHMDHTTPVALHYNCVADAFELEGSAQYNCVAAHSITVSPAKGRVRWSLNAALSVTEAPQRRRERAMELEEWAEGNAGLPRSTRFNWIPLHGAGPCLNLLLPSPSTHPVASGASTPYRQTPA
ncbi:hypothetical protein BDN71DRAFT_1437248 [Pleurotus eryngii]|uniref:Uncharacterized protein n=1 Tax=Pleurotus eryngii TaxID=5323 RepID=A0A9P6D101_PLEER|nr:hypothetical protein BDN71DRAFT_1437248 [Pleurotus eryngii]